MEYRYLGGTGLKVSALSFGAWVTFGDQVGEDVALACMKRAFDAGVNFFDNAEVYSNGQAEIMMGSVLEKTGWQRKDLVISTKLFWGGDGPNDRGLSRKHIIEGTEASLDRLKLSYVDIMFCHRPDYHTPVEETVRAMNHIINKGQAFYWGTSEWSAAEIMEAYAVARQERLIPPVVEQPQYNMFARERVEKEYLPLYEKIGLGTTTWSPLASGILTGKYVASVPEGSRMDLEKYHWLRSRLDSEEGKMQNEIAFQLHPIAEELGCSLAQLAIAWCALNPFVSTVITGASKPEQVTQNMQSLEIVPLLTEKVIERIETILGNKPVQPVDFR